MRIATAVIGLLAALAPVRASLWSNEDHEIFRVRDELAGVLGADVSFYDFVGVTPTASLDEINKAYRKKTRALHPDKVKQQLTAEKTRARRVQESQGKPRGPKPKPPTAAEVRAAVKKASDMQARLSIVTNILRGPGRDRYDHFLANGFPVWKGTGYYYSRYRPGFGTVLFGLFVFVGGGAHYLALYMGWKRQREFMDRYIRYARRTAWGDSLGAGLDDAATAAAAAAAAPPPPVEDETPAGPSMAGLNRKQRRMHERETKREEKSAGTTTRRPAGRRAGRHAPGGADSAAASGTATPVPSGGPTGPKKRVVAENGKVLIVDSLGDVYLEQLDDEGNVEELLLDMDAILPPTFQDTAVYRLPTWLYGLTVGRVLAGSPAVAPVENDDDDDTSSAGKATPSTDSNEEFELLGASTESLGRARATGSSNNNGSKPTKRKGRK